MDENLFIKLSWKAYDNKISLYVNKFVLVKGKIWYKNSHYIILVSLYKSLNINLIY